MYHLMYNSTKFKGPMVLGPNARVLWFQQLSKHAIQFEIVILTKIVPLWKKHHTKLLLMKI